MSLNILVLQHELWNLILFNICALFFFYKDISRRNSVYIYHILHFPLFVYISRTFLLLPPGVCFEISHSRYQPSEESDPRHWYSENIKSTLYFAVWKGQYHKKMMLSETHGFFFKQVKGPVWQDKSSICVYSINYRSVTCFKYLNLFLETVRFFSVAQCFLSLTPFIEILAFSLLAQYEWNNYIYLAILSL